MANVLAYGFVGLSHLNAERISTVGVDRVWRAIAESAAEHSRNINGLMAAMVERTAVAKERFMLPGSGTLQPIDQWGNPLPVREAGYYDVAYPIQGAGTAWGSNRVSRALMTVEEANRQTVETMRRDADWMRRHILASVFDNVAWAYNDEIGPGGAAGLGSITVECLANSDGTTFNLVGGTAADDEHYLAQAASIDDNNDPFDDIYEELMQHPSNRGPVVVYVPTNLTASIESLTAFIEVGDPDIRFGTNTDQLGGVIDRGLGDEVLGKIDKCWIIHWRALPDSYMLAHAQGAGPFVMMREYPDTSLQGLFMERNSPDGNLEEVRMLRYAGFGVRNRIAACVYRIGNGSYAIPSGYDAPLAV